jgi:Tol biopolymer transport system component
VAFVSDRSGDWQVWVANADGSGAVKLTSILLRSTPLYPLWSPDGASIVFHGNPGGRPDVIVVPASGGRPRFMTAELSNGAFPSFSRDGRWIYFCRTEGTERRVWKMPVTGGEAVKVTNTFATRSIESPDGRDLYFLDAPIEGPGAVWRVPLAGGAPVKVLDGVQRGAFDVVERGIYYLERVADNTVASKPMVQAGPARTRLVYFDFSTGRSTTVARDLGMAASFGASWDGRHVFFSRLDSFIDELMVVDDFR